MITIVEPKEYIDKLWGKQNIKENIEYRLMKYVFVLEYDGKVFLHNIVSGQLVVLEKKEALALRGLPRSASEVIAELIYAHFLVPINYDEHYIVVAFRNILRKLASTRNSNQINTFTILPTTTCNARCYYCFEQGANRETMSEKTAEEVVDFIVKHCDRNKDIRLSWFGGEPTLAAERISQICKGLKERNIRYSSYMTTNGYLLKDGMIQEAVDLWNLQSVMICFDGTETSHNRAKAFLVKSGSPYKQVLNNIGLLLKNQINVHARMNFDLGNYREFKDLIQELSTLYKNSSNLSVTAHPVNGEYTDWDGNLMHGSSEWFEKTIPQLQSISREEGFFKVSDELPNMRFENCEAASESAVTITPSGMLVSCPEQFDDSEIKGNLKDGITNQDLVRSWKVIADYPRCINCSLFPYCIRFEKCSAKDRCNYRMELNILTELAIVQNYKKWLASNHKGGISNEISGTKGCICEG